MKKVTIKIPDGYELVQTGESKWELQKIEFPKTWEEFCETYPVHEEECYIGEYSNISEVSVEQRVRCKNYDRNYLPNKKTAEAFLALMQLVQLMKCYNGDWEPDWTDSEPKYTIVNDLNNLKKARNADISHVLVFKSEELRDQFFENFRDLIEIAIPLI